MNTSLLPVRRMVVTTGLLGLIGSGLVLAARAETPAIPTPVIPAHVFKITDFGAIGDGKTLNTLAFQKAIDACTKAGGGTVLTPSGKFLTGTLTLASNLNLKIEAGGTILISSNTADFTLATNGFNNCIMTKGCHDVSITGEGTIDGQGADWWPRYVKTRVIVPGAPPPPHRPYMVVFSNCTRVLVQGVTLTNSPSFHLVPDQCHDVTIDGIKIFSPDPSPNTDGIDPSGWNYLIKNCTIDVGDDNIAVKPGNIQTDKEHLSCENFTITDCKFIHGHGMSIGGQCRGGLRNMTVRNCTFDSTQAGIRMKAPRGAGGLVENVTYDNLTMHNVKISIYITSYYPKAPADVVQDPIQAVNDLTPIWKHVRISNITSEGGSVAGIIYGLPEMPVSDIVMTNVKISADKSMDIIHAKGIQFVNSQITSKSSPPVKAQNAEVSGLDLVSGK